MTAFCGLTLVAGAGAGIVTTNALAAPAPAAGSSTESCTPAAGGTRLCTSFRRLDRQVVTPKFAKAVAAKAVAGTRMRALVAAPANTWEADPTPAKVPAECLIKPTRVSTCEGATVTMSILDTQGAVIGHVEMEILAGVALANNGLTWKVSARAYLTSATGTATTTRIGAVAQCAGACHVATAVTTSLPIQTGNYMRGSWQITSTTPGATPVLSNQRVLFQFFSSTGVNLIQVAAAGIGTVRCDNGAAIGLGRAACVYPGFTPVFTLSRAALPASRVHAAFVAAAQAAGKPGAPNKAPLRREADPKKAAAHHAAACKGFVAKRSPVGTPMAKRDSCDQYPFAGTKQGGVGNAIGHVPSLDNTNGGSKYSAFIRTQRLLDNDPFFVRVVA